MKKRGLPSGSAGLLLLAALATNAETNSETGAQDSADASIESVVVTATRLADARSTSSTNVIDAWQIDARQTASVVEMLRQSPGVNIFQQGGRGGISNVLLRGGESNFTVVMIDGVKVNDTTNTRGGAYDFSNLSVAGFQRIEIVRGPMSSVYGSDALAGVVQLFSRDAGTDQHISLQAGSDSFFSVAGALSEQFSTGGVALTLHAARDDSDVDGAAWEGRGLIARFDSDFSERSQVSLFLRLHDSESTSFPDNSGGPELAILRDVDTRDSDEEHVRVAWNLSRPGSWNLDVDSSIYRREEALDSPGIAAGILDAVPASTSDTEFTRDHVATTLSVMAGESTQIALGAEWQREDGVTLGTLDIGFPVSTDFRLDRRVVGVFVEASVEVGAAFVNGSIRNDDFDGMTRETTAKLGAAYFLSNGRTELRANWGQGFKAPSFFALAHPLIGNPALRAEFADSTDILLKHRLGKGRAVLELSFFRNEYRDLIDFDPETFSLVNRSSVVTQGAELGASWPIFEALHLRGHLSYLDSDIRNSDAKLHSRPKWRGGLVADWLPSERWQVSASALVVDQFYESSIATATVLLDGYLRLDLAVTQQISDRLAWHFSVDNLLDANYQEAVGFPAPGIRGRIGIRFTL